MLANQDDNQDSTDPNAPELSQRLGLQSPIGKMIQAAQPQNTVSPWLKPGQPSAEAGGVKQKKGGGHSAIESIISDILNPGGRLASVLGSPVQGIPGQPGLYTGSTNPGGTNFKNQSSGKKANPPVPGPAKPTNDPNAQWNNPLYDIVNPQDIIAYQQAIQPMLNTMMNSIQNNNSAFGQDLQSTLSGVPSQFRGLMSAEDKNIQALGQENLDATRTASATAPLLSVLANLIQANTAQKQALSTAASRNAAGTVISPLTQQNITQLAQQLQAGNYTGSPVGGLGALGSLTTGLNPLQAQAALASNALNNSIVTGG